MTLLQKLSLAATIGSATFSFAASLPNKTILPDNVVRCEPSSGCINKTIAGRNYNILTTPRFTVMVAVSHEGIYTRADISITNNTDMPLSLSPEDFRVEVVTPKPKVLLYVPPANLSLPPAAPPAVAPDPNSSEPPTLPTGAKTFANPAAPETDATNVVAPAKGPENRDLSATSVPPSEATSGRVYFERDKHAHLVNVVLPLAGVVFEFPYAMKK
ncbi:MAG TPA: hypothetical protein VK813_13920 [Edaphobacter sp.]|jgi:hypothetical protein|nr:hypothetical protein [Edaphobacter sp.]